MVITALRDGGRAAGHAAHSAQRHKGELCAWVSEQVGGRTHGEIWAARATVKQLYTPLLPHASCSFCRQEQGNSAHAHAWGGDGSGAAGPALQQLDATLLQKSLSTIPAEIAVECYY